MQKYISQLNEAQQEPVLQKDGPMIIIAGAGSGKTRVLTIRIAYLMSLGVDSFSILALTFTNKAAREMKKRISDIVGAPEAKNLWMGTFHSVFARILRSEADKLGYPSNFTIYDSQDSLRCISGIIKEMQLDKDVYKPKQILGRISSYKNSLITVKAYFNNPELQEADAMSKKPRLGEIYQAYVEKCFKSGAMDFDDLLLKTNELLSRFPEVLAKYQNRFRYILVDEYQDTNHSQYLIVRALSDRFQNICVVGDDAQSIYAFRGANIQNILSFEKDYPDLKTFKLEQNYRSTKTIVQAANSVITNNRNQLKKEVWTQNHDGDKIKLLRALSDNEEGTMVAQNIFEEKMNHQLNNIDFAILYRTNAQSRSMEEALRRMNIPYRIYGGMSFYGRKEIKDLLAYFRLAINPTDEEAVKRVINYPKREIGKTSLDRLVVAAGESNVSVWEIMQNIHEFKTGINTPTRDRISDFVTLIKSWHIMLPANSAYDMANHIANTSGMLRELAIDRTPEGISHYENLQELLNGIKEFSDNGVIPLEAPSVELNNDGLRALDQYMQDIALLTDADKTDDGNNDRVQLMTIHSAKGLEFKNVFIVGLEENLFPSQMALSSRADLEEERRLFYVAITRAENKLTLSYSVSRYRWGNLIGCEPSRFLEEINPECIEAIVPRAIKKIWDDDNQENWSGYGSTNSSPRTSSSRSTTNYKAKAAAPKPTNNTVAPKGFKKLSTLPTNASNDNFVADEDLSRIAVGMDVEHQRFGFGKIISMEGKFPDNKALILFNDHGQKQLLLKFAKLKILSS